MGYSSFMKKLLFVCLGNICRSPTAEGIMWHLIKEQQLNDAYYCDSAGTSGWHIDEPADSRMRQHAAKRGYELESLARKFIAADFEAFDLILAMDQSNYDDIVAMTSKAEHHAKVRLMTDYCRRHQVNEVPDPYYGGAAGFEKVLDILEDACEELLNELET